MLRDVVWEKVQGLDPNLCHWQSAFYRLRRKSMELTGRKRHEIRPDTPLADLLQRVIRMPGGRRWTREDVTRDVKALVQEQLGTPDSKYSETADFVRDLGMG